MKIQILCDNLGSWMVPFAYQLQILLKNKGHDVRLIFEPDDVISGDILVMISCEKIFKSLHLNQHNLVVHESALPHGRGWSPLTWQVLEGKNAIPISLIEATEKVDAGIIYDQIIIEFEGTELIDEMRSKQAEATIKLVDRFVDNYRNTLGRQQDGEVTYYRRRTNLDSRLNVNSTIAEQFNLLRVCDNDRYPAWFELKGKKYILKIYNENK